MNPRGIARRRSWRLVLSICAAVALVLIAVARAGRNAQRRAEGLELDLATVRRDLCTQVLPLGQHDGTADSAGLAAILQLAAGATILGLGESTHGTAEFFQLKARLIRLLVERAGVRTIAFEASWERAAAVDRFLTNGEGDPRAVVQGLGFWTWSTEEVAALVEWMRQFNLGRPGTDQVRFAGFDPQFTASWDLERRLPRFAQLYLRDRQMADRLHALAAARRETGPVVAWAHDGHLARAWPYMGRWLGKRYGDGYRTIALVADTGRFNAMIPDSGGRFVLGAALLQPPPPRSVEGLMSGCGHESALLPIAAARRASPVVAAALEAPLRMRSVGAVVTSDSMPQFFPRRAVAFDMLWHTRRSTPTRLIPLPGMRLR